MIDLSNNNATGHNFEVVRHKGGQLRVYLKLVEGTGFVDQTYAGLRDRALKAGLRVGAYAFLHPLEATPEEAAAFFISRLPATLKPGRDLRPCLDCEWGTPTPAVGEWITRVAAIVEKKKHVKPLMYGGGYYFDDCQLKKAPGPLWLPAYGRNDGREYPIGVLPHPWRTMAAHQYTSVAHVLGIDGECDLSHVFHGASIEIPKRKR